MKKFEITEEQIKKIHECTSVNNQEELEKWFPEAFKAELEVGKWYKSKEEAIFFVAEVDKKKGEEGDVKGYGVNYHGKWASGWDWANVNNEHGFNVEATKEEVKNALIKEAERRGFKYNVEFKEVEDRRNGSAFRQKTGKVGNCFDFSHNSLYTIGYGRWCVFKDGVWAEIVKEPVTLNYHQIAEKFGIDVEQLRITTL